MRIVGSRIDDTIGLLVATTIIKGYDYIKSRFMNVDKLSDWPKWKQEIPFITKYEVLNIEPITQTLNYKC